MSPTTKTHTRLAGVEDAEVIARLNRLFNEVDAPPEVYAARMAAPGRVDYPILAEVAGQVVGFANLRLLSSLYYAEPYAEISEMFVETAYRRQGVGLALLAHAERLARKAGAEELLVLTGVDNHPALRLYRSAGFEGGDVALTKPLLK